ncbi:MAG: efflux RND transporter periplasmic adaptor subunit [Gemmataceae bacterium]|nr:efflux RND transporter periplasmic adaptor subunit [Gemmataceae bacterium]
MTTPASPQNSPATPSLSERVQSLRMPDAGSMPARGSSSIVPWTLCAVLAVATAFFAIRGGGVASTDEPKEEDLEAALLAKLDPSKAPKGKDGAAMPSSSRSQEPAGPIALESKGYIIPVHQIQVSPKVGGMVMELNIEEGMQVKEGFILAKLETTDYQADHDRAVGVATAAKARWQELWKYREDEVKQVKADFDEATHQRTQLLSDWKRSVDLRRDLALSPKEFEQAESQYRAMESRMERLRLTFELIKKGPRDEKIAAAKAEWDQAEADFVKAKWKLDNTTVRAPLAGTILSKKAEKGNMINPAAFSNGLSASLCEMADLSDMEVDLAIAERDISKIYKGQKCQVRPEAFPDRQYTGEVSRIMPTADRSKGAVPVRVKIDIPREEEGQFLRPEMGAVVTFYTKGNNAPPAKK